MSEWLIGEYLVIKGIINRPQLEEALKLQRQRGGLLGEILVNSGFTTEEKIIGCLARQLRIPYVDLKTFMFKPEVVELIPRDIARRYDIIALSKIEGIITVAMTDPLNLPVIKKISDLTNCEVQTVFASRADIRNAIYKLYAKEAGVVTLESASAQTAPFHPEGPRASIDSDIKSMISILDKIIKDISRLRYYLIRLLQQK